MSVAVIFQTADHTNTFTRQTAIVKTGDHQSRSFTRVLPKGASRADWSEFNLPVADINAVFVSPFASSETLVGRPVSIPVTDTDVRDHAIKTKPTTLLQKLVRAVEAHGGLGLSSLPATPVWDDLSVEVETGVAVKYTKGISAFTGDAVAPAPVVAPVVVVEPAPVAPPVVAPVVIVEPVEPAPVHASSASEVMQLASVITVPTAEEVGQYFSRTIDECDEETIYASGRSTRQPVLLLGDAGTGKTSSARHIAFKWQVPFVQLELTPSTTKTEIVGGFVPTSERGVAIWRDSELITAIQQPSVVLLNELSRMPAKNASYFLRLLEEGKVYIPELGRTIKVHDECLIIADMNVGYKGVTGQDEALLTRFLLKMEFEYDTDIEKNFISSANLLDLATKLRSAYKRKELSFPVSTRALKAFVMQAQGLNFAFAVRSFLTNFSEKDRPAVTDILHTHADGIAKDLGVDLGSFVIQDIEAHTV
jgi:MoxR-like ATPase